ncbi:MAG: LysM peptidoglycan-binding domain-containing protein [Phycisphaerales bacterium]|jgi:nucleoid-associated protein YgaU
MTSDAKVGLLLGLAFIFIIAFIINGLPSFKHQPENNNELTHNMARPQNTPPGIGTTARRVNRDVITRIEPVRQSPETSQLDVQAESQPVVQTVRFETELPQPAIAVQKLPRPTQTLQKTQITRSAKARIYVVEEGDSLAYIAKKFYGDQEGNRKVNIDGIFRANRKILRSADNIYIGQKLIIPPLKEVLKKTDESLVALAPEKLEPVESVGRRHPVKQDDKTAKAKHYVVKDGDSLWVIASEQLGNGNRYPEIAKLNSKIIKDEDLLVVGMRLKLPAH